MNWLGVTLLAALLATAPGYAGAQQPEAKGAPTGTQTQGAAVKAEAPGKPASLTPEEKQAYLKKTTAELDKLQQEIYDLRLNVTKAPPQQRRTIMVSAKNLQLQAVAARNQLKALEKAPQPAWNEEKAKLDKIMADLRKSLGKT